MRSGRKDDNGKAPWDLLPWDAVREVVYVLRHGAKKYGARNWETGISYSRLFAATVRHLDAWWSGETFDQDTHRNHLSHAACCVLFLLALHLRGKRAFDDRPSQKGVA